MIVTRQPACSVLSGGSISARLCVYPPRPQCVRCLPLYGTHRIREDALRILAPFRLRRRGVETKLVLATPRNPSTAHSCAISPTPSPGSTESKQAKPMSRVPPKKPSQRTACASNPLCLPGTRHRPRHCRRPPARWADLELPLASSASRRLGETASARRNAVRPPAPTS